MFKEKTNYNLLSVEVTDILFYWGYDIEAKTQIEKADLEKVPDIIEIEGGKDLNVAMRNDCPAVTDIIFEGT